MTFARFAVVALMLQAPLLAAEPLPGVGGDPRVQDAVRAWEEWVEYRAGVDGVPAVSTAVVHDQEIVAVNAFGEAVTPETLYSICSISKLFTSVAVMQQRDAGKLRLDDPVAEHLSWFSIRDVHPNDRPVTVRALLTHSAGLPRESDYPYWTDEGFPFPTREEIRKKLGEQETLYPSSRYYQYSNLGLTLAGEIVSEVSGEPFATYVRERILRPLDMGDTYPEVPVDLRGSRMAIGHSERKRDGSRDVVPAFETRGIAPAAGFVSNVVDLSKFAMWQHRLLSDGSGDEVLASSTLREMQRVQWVDPDWKTTRGLGFAVSREGERTFVHHGGACPGYYSHFRLEPKSRIAVIVLTNAIGADVRLYTGRAFDLIAPAIESSIERPDAIPERDPDLDRYTGIYDSIWGQSAVVRWKDGLAELWLGSRDPKEALAELRPTDTPHVFRRVRDDGNGLGETVVFDVTDDGSVLRYKQHSNWYRKVR